MADSIFDQDPGTLGPGMDPLTMGILGLAGGFGQGAMPVARKGGLPFGVGMGLAAQGMAGGLGQAYKNQQEQADAYSKQLQNVVTRAGLPGTLGQMQYYNEMFGTPEGRGKLDQWFRSNMPGGGGSTGLNVASGSPAPMPGIAGGTAPNANKDAFVTNFAPIAQSIAQKTGLSAQYVLAQMGLETGWGTSPAAAKNNFFGISDANGKPLSYATPQEGVQAYIDQMNSPRYKNVPRLGTPQQIGDAMAVAGYNPNVPQPGKADSYGTRVGNFANSLGTNVPYNATPPSFQVAQAGSGALPVPGAVPGMPGPLPGATPGLSPSLPGGGFGVPRTAEEAGGMANALMAQARTLAMIKMFPAAMQLPLMAKYNIQVDDPAALHEAAKQYREMALAGPKKFLELQAEASMAYRIQQQKSAGENFQVRPGGTGVVQLPGGGAAWIGAPQLTQTVVPAGQPGAGTQQPAYITPPAPTLTPMFPGGAGAPAPAPAAPAPAPSGAISPPAISPSVAAPPGPGGAAPPRPAPAPAPAPAAPAPAPAAPAPAPAPAAAAPAPVPGAPQPLPLVTKLSPLDEQRLEQAGKLPAKRYDEDGAYVKDHIIPTLGETMNNKAGIMQLKTVIPGAYTGFMGETRAALRNLVQQFAPGLAADMQWDATDAQILQKLATLIAGKQERGDQGARGGIQLLEAYLKANIGMENTPTANMHMANALLVMYQYREDWANGALGHYNKEGSRVMYGDNKYTPVNSFDEGFVRTAQPRLYKAAIDAANGDANWNKGLDADQQAWVGGILQRADPSLTISMTNKKGVVAHDIPVTSFQNVRGPGDIRVVPMGGGGGG